VIYFNFPAADNQDIRPPGVGGDICGVSMAERNGGIRALFSALTSWPSVADDIAPAHNYYLGAVDFNAAADEHLLDAGRGAGQ